MTSRTDGAGGSGRSENPGDDGRSDASAGFFNCTDADRAAFEAGIKLGGIFHQFVGTPLDDSNREALETAIRKSVAVQPFVESASVRIRPGPASRGRRP